jgi:hypothetical protein
MVGDRKILAGLSFVDRMMMMIMLMIVMIKLIMAMMTMTDQRFQIGSLSASYMGGSGCKFQSRFHLC